MLRNSFCRFAQKLQKSVQRSPAPAAFSTDTSLDQGLFMHHGQRPRYRNYKKFESPRKKANKLFAEIKQEAIETSKASNPKVFDTKFQVGDAIEIEMVIEGGVKSDNTEKVRGVVIGKFNKGIDSSVLIRDVVFGQPIERKIPLHSPLLRSLRVLEKNFIYKGKRKIKRSKLYFLRDRNPLLTRVTK